LLSSLEGYKKLSVRQKEELKLPYINTTLLINELVKLEHDENNGNIRVYEKTGMRKDRYSSLSYNFYLATQLEAKLSRRREAGYIANDFFMFKPPKIK